MKELHPQVQVKLDQHFLKRNFGVLHYWAIKDDKSRTHYLTVLVGSDKVREIQFMRVYREGVEWKLVIDRRFKI